LLRLLCSSMHSAHCAAVVSFPAHAAIANISRQQVKQQLGCPLPPWRPCSSTCACAGTG
jgi:hypothetical protein